MNSTYGALVKIWDDLHLNSHRELWSLENLDDLKRIVKKFTDDGFVVELEGIAKNTTE